MTEPASATRFDLESARQAGQEGRLHEWVAELLSSPGSDNEVLAAALAQRRRWWHGPFLLELDELTPLAGPDDEVIVPIDEDEWEDDVGDMVEALEEGWEPPPMLVSYRDGQLFLEDGNHRHETLRRAGERHGWAVVCFESPDDLDRFVATLPAPPPPAHP
jgi:hypothetical protein